MTEMDRTTGIFVDGIGAAAATSGVLSQLQGRIFALLYLRAEPLALEDVAATLGQSKSNVSVNIRGLIDWHLVRRVPIPGSRKDHYEAATGFWRVMQEIAGRRPLGPSGSTRDDRRTPSVRPGQSVRGEPIITARLTALRMFFRIDAVGAFSRSRSTRPACDRRAARAARPRRAGGFRVTHEPPSLSAALAHLRATHIGLGWTSFVPFAAILSGRQRLVLRELPWASLAAALPAIIFLRWGHGSIFARGGVWVIATVVGGAAVLMLQDWRMAQRRIAPSRHRSGGQPPAGLGTPEDRTEDMLALLVVLGRAQQAVAIAQAAQHVPQMAEGGFQLCSAVSRVRRERGD
jgi:hypothetical protein